MTTSKDVLTGGEKETDVNDGERAKSKEGDVCNLARWGSLLSVVNGFSPRQRRLSELGKQSRAASAPTNKTLAEPITSRGGGGPVGNATRVPKQKVIWAQATAHEQENANHGAHLQPTPSTLPHCF